MFLGKEKGPDFSGPIPSIETTTAQEDIHYLTGNDLRFQLFSQPAVWAIVSLTCNVFAALSIFGGAR